MRQLALINLENVSGQEVAVYSIREAARAVVFDENKNIALLHATKNHYYKLPGGGVESGEDPITALKRECKEEVGSDIQVMGELGLVVEYRRHSNLKQMSYCYVARVVGGKGFPELTESEIEEGFETVWLPLDEAKKRVSESRPTIADGPYMVSRDIVFLNAID